MWSEGSDSIPKLEEWIITKNENGKRKVANCEEDETHIYDKTRDWLLISEPIKELEEAESCISRNQQVVKSEIGVDKNQTRFITVNLFIRDLLNAEKINNFFCFNNIMFKTVDLCGTIVGTQMRNEKLFIQVDDGTCSIKCIISLKDLNRLKNLVDLEVYRDECAREKDKDVKEAANILMSTITHLANTIPAWEELKLGDVVRIIGRMTEFNNERNIFIKKIRKFPPESTVLCSYLDQMIQQNRESYCGNVDNDSHSNHEMNKVLRKL